MKKHLINYILFFGFTPSSFSDTIPKLGELSFQTIFNRKEWPKQKERINNLLKEAKVPLDALNFEGKLIAGLDFSDMYLKGIDFRGGTFYNVNFSNADLSELNFNDATFKECNLKGALLCENYRVKSNDHYELVKEYSDLMNRKEEYENLGLTEEVEKLDKQTDALNKLFSALNLKLYHDLSNFNLININFKNADLNHAQLQGARLSKDFKVPDYKEPNELFEAWDKANRENLPEKEFYNKLVNARFPIFFNIPNERLKKVYWEGLDLSNSYFLRAQLQGINLSKTNLENATIINSNLNNTVLIDVNLKNTDLNSSNLSDTWISKDLKINYHSLFEEWKKANEKNAPHKKYFNQLFNSNLNILKDISNERLKEIRWEGLKLKNSNLICAQLQGITLLKINLENANLESACLNETYLNKVNLNFANLLHTKFKGAHLKSVSLVEANLYGADFTDATLEDVDFYGAYIDDLKLSNTTTLPFSEDNNDNDHIDFYHSCTDLKAKALLKIILESRGHVLNS